MTKARRVVMCVPPMRLATVVKYVAVNWGVNFQYAQPFNEMAETWWQYPAGQERDDDGRCDSAGHVLNAPVILGVLETARQRRVGLIREPRR
ncbi:MAG: hypothetical protein H8F28_05250 [Fibrella sp.]|nr:hypothetical protein [Armatimonadota bacterium]